MTRLCTHIYVYWVLSGLCLGVAFQLPWTWPLYIPGLWLLLLAVNQKPKPTTTKMFLGLLLVGSLKAAGALSWFWATYPLDWITVPPGTIQLVLIGGYWITSALSIGVGFALIMSISLRYLMHTELGWWLLPLVWVLAEVAGSFTFSIFMLGPGSSLNAAFSFGYLGYLLADFPVVLPFAKLGGVYALTALAVFMVVCGWQLHQRTYTKRQLLWGMLTVVFVVGGVSIWSLRTPPAASTKTVTTINTDFTASQMRSTLGLQTKQAEVFTRVRTALKSDTDIILLPEDARFTYQFPNTKLALDYITRTAAERPVTLIDSARLENADGTAYVRAFIYDTKTESVSLIDKQYLAPQGEYVPYFYGWFIKKIAPASTTAHLYANHNYRPGPEISYDQVPSHIPPVLFCMESVSPFGVRRALKERPAPIVLHQVSHAWFHEPKTLWLALDRMLRVQAWWNNVTIVKAHNLSN